MPTKVDIAHLISAGVLGSICSRPLIDEVLALCGKNSQRNRMLPAPAVVYLVMAIALWREAPIEEVLRVVCEGLAMAQLWPSSCFKSEQSSYIASENSAWI